MSLRLILSRRARTDLDDIWNFSASRWSPAQADRYLMGLDGIVRLICQEPHLGRLRQELVPEFRMYPYRSHLIFYRDDPVTIDVVRVLHTRTDWQTLNSE